MASLLKLKQFHPGDYAYARFFGDNQVLIESKMLSKSGFPHYVCLAKSGERYLISKLWLSTKRISPETDDSNCKQLELTEVKNS